MSPILIKLYFSLAESDVSAIRSWTFKFMAFFLPHSAYSTFDQRVVGKSLLH